MAFGFIEDIHEIRQIFRGIHAKDPIHNHPFSRAKILKNNYNSRFGNWKEKLWLPWNLMWRGRELTY